MCLHTKRQFSKSHFHVRAPAQGHKSRQQEEMTSGTWAVEAHLAQGEASGVDVHLGEAQVFERGG